MVLERRGTNWLPADQRYFVPQHSAQPAAQRGQLSQPSEQPAHAAAQSLTAGLAAEQAPQSLPQQAAQSSTQPGQVAHTLTAWVAPQQLAQSTAQRGHASQLFAHPGHGTAQHAGAVDVTGVLLASLVESQPIRPARDRTTNASDRVAVMTESPLLEMNGVMLTGTSPANSRTPTTAEARVG
jgi:hypothetical protein